MSLGIALIVGLHLSIGVLLLWTMLHPAAPAKSIAAATTVTAPIEPTKAAKTAAPSTTASRPAVYATLFAPQLLARENAGLAQLRAAGINLETLLHHAAPRRRIAHEGGPFVPLAAMRQAALDPVRLARLEQIIARVPFASPLRRYDVSSPFGVRRDPFNGEPAFHPGIDLEADRGAPVYATAPGRVDLAGWVDGYGRMVEIDHGNGIRTRYAHLSRILVRIGERVVTHERIGLVGSSGRSTGPHLHYEVRIDGRPVNPAKFLNAGRRFQLVKTVAAE
jgi:murein DD-endopeptidase MepM/ murein hydrolase activator NlpD